ncbi:kinase-like protein [Fomitiporia mediterranea MF3/22]|uniref:kinase-like protein n=1 Tax=Fomitiporia mediterranea (strain MF3/22) TaxID=694068 RepID=UPI0004407EF5|nr:kinase-like protein [Fomitiporia mediterranea MF3/22]EJD05142.1 kinase-like protein [Fomitiporia mediterranea MF3/22]
MTILQEIERLDIEQKNGKPARFAAKLICRPRDYNDRDGSENKKVIEKARYEAQLMMELRHPHVLLKGLAYIHSKNVVHCDIKPANLLIKSRIPGHPTSTRGDNVTEKEIVVICDFGIARKLPEDKSLEFTDGPRQYMAPEVWNEDKHTTKADIWSAGSVVCEFLTGNNFYDKIVKLYKIQYHILKEVAGEMTSEQVEYMIKNLPSHIPEVAEDFLRRCLEVDLEKRCSAEEALQHKWFQEGVQTTESKKASVTPEKVENQKQAYGSDPSAKEESKSKGHDRSVNPESSKKKRDGHQHIGWKRGGGGGGGGDFKIVDI